MRLNRRIIQKLLNNFGGEEYVKPLRDGESTRLYEIIHDTDKIGDYLSSASLFIYKVKRQGGGLHYTLLKLFKIKNIKRNAWGKVVSYEID